MSGDNIDNTLFRKVKDNETVDEIHLNDYLELYRIYLHVFNSTADRSQKTNEFFLGLNTAIMGILGYVETKNFPHGNLIFLLIPFIGISVSYSWYKMINSYSQLNRAKFRVIHELEEKLPLSLFKTEWHILGKGKDPKKYLHFSKIERTIPITFIVLYVVILIVTLFG